MVIVQTSLGQLHGIHNKDFDVFKGIPYAVPPIGKRRFRHAELWTQRWEGTRDARAFGAVPVQPPNTLEAFFSANQSSYEQNEDCLTLNIWRPNSSRHQRPLPVLLYFYGGSFVNGHSAQDLYQPEAIVKQEPVIVVTCNYRLGALGFLDWSALNQTWDSNNGLSDQICALQWVYEHIAAFGGDPTHITLVGQSAGAMSIQALLQLPQVQPLVRNAVLMSGILQPDTAEHAQQKAQEFQSLKLQVAPDTPWEELSSETILDLMGQHQAQYGKSKGLELLYQPVTTNQMPIHQNAPLPCPIWMGITTSEGDIYIKNAQKVLAPIQFQKVISRAGLPLPDVHEIETAQQQRDYITQHYFHSPFHHYVKLLKPHTDVYTYLFDWSHSAHPLYHSAYHILDVLFWFGRLDIIKAQGAMVTQHEEQLSQQMIHDLYTFAYTSQLPQKYYQYQ
ncbi:MULTISPECIES: carboxylesterase family protein [unclassified Staphylococcus]|uniref:carboxylesterase family protein n=1 Tax=unclassified Staphylococcus TaxID=91994 RepID=UPI0021CF7189|nr:MULTISPECIES: carboxylesterase family protein [unclassified Staphylococcus]UXR71591.1 carboxylesterase family protein [Staphylococcus sp. IVB6240]UXR73867.1 carboxylesterase family protein [Staphylococcus sp. IVB6238]UXR76188.1 carboxylesterase family protein [Staphylococcus sp. IVB6233]UXR80385.1 carboxylesterase family protein [Staphylococcus sp. IVB6218]